MGQKPPSSIAAKRRASKIPAITKKVEAGKATGLERGFVRLGRGQTRVLTGQEDLSTWTDEELRVGRKMSIGGDFRGRPPNIVPKAIHDELVKRTLDNAAKLLRENLQEAVEALVAIVKGADTEDKDKLKAIAMIMDRVMGKTPEKIDLTVGEQKPWEVALETAIVGSDEDAADIIEANALEIEDDDDNPFGLDDEEI